MKRNQIAGLVWAAAFAAAMLTTTSCNRSKFTVNGQITDAKDSVLYFDHMSLSGAVTLDSVKLKDDGSFSFRKKAVDAPDFFRLRIAHQIINVAIDSSETVTIKASYPTMAAQYEVSGSEDTEKIKELALLQMGLQQQLNKIANSLMLGIEAVSDSITNVVERYKDHIKRNYIYAQPMKASSYFALFQTIRSGNANLLLFNPRNSEEDIKAFAAVATSWDTYYPGAERGTNLHNIAIQGMKDVRILKNRQNQTVDANIINTSGVIDIALPDNKGVTRRLTDLKGKVVLLDFHVFATEKSLERIMLLREVYNKYHAQGLEIYQVSLDPDEHFWKTQTAALPWICVRDADSMSSPLIKFYNLVSLPTFYLVNRDNELYKRDNQIADLEAEIKALL